MPSRTPAPDPAEDADPAEDSAAGDKQREIAARIEAAFAAASKPDSPSSS